MKRDFQYLFSSKCWKNNFEEFVEKKIEMFCSAVAESAEGGGGCGRPEAAEGA